MDHGFVRSFIGNEERQSVRDFLSESPYADLPEYRYVLSNSKYFDINVSFHGHPLAVAWVENEAIYCAPTLERLKEIEAVGESEPGWTIRKFFLDKALQNLELPGDEDDGGLPYEYFRSFVLEASRRYASSQRPAFAKWVWQALDVMNQQRQKIEDGSAGLSSAEQNKMFDERVLFLRGLTKP